MKNLQLLININARFSGEVNYLPNGLRILDWPGFPAQCLPSDFNPQKLVKLNMPNSRISRLGQGLKNLQNLTSLSFKRCEFLTEVPDLSGRFPNLEELNLNYCQNLAELHPSVGFLDKLLYFDLRNCRNLKTFPRMVNMKSLCSIDFGGCKRLENIPEIEGRMESLRLMNLSRTAMTEVPSSIRYHLSNLRLLELENCENLTTLPRSIFELELLINITGCPKLGLPPVPNKVEYSEASKSNISHHGKQISSENDDDQGNFAFPFLSYLCRRRCNISNLDFLMTLGIVTSLRGLDLSHSNLVSLPTGLTRCINLEELILDGCKMLQEFTELPPNLQRLSVRGCVYLERISKLSNILKRQESQMFRWLDLRNCWRLWNNLVWEAEMNGLIGNDDRQVETDLFSLFLSSQKSAFSVVLPGMREISRWFSCPMDSKEDGVCEFHIQVLANFTWENTGVALCVVVSQNKPDVKFKFFLNEVLVMIDIIDLPLFDFETPYVLLRYIPFGGMDLHPAFGYTRPVPPFQCRVIIYPSYYPGENPMRSCGVHLVMPPNEACMELSPVLCRTDTMEAEDENVDELETSGQQVKKRFYRGGPSGLKDVFGDELESNDGCVDELEASDV